MKSSGGSPMQANRKFTSPCLCGPKAFTTGAPGGTTGALMNARQDKTGKYYQPTITRQQQKQQQNIK